MSHVMDVGEHLTPMLQLAVLPWSVPVLPWLFYGCTNSKLLIIDKQLSSRLPIVIAVLSLPELQPGWWPHKHYSSVKDRRQCN